MKQTLEDMREELNLILEELHKKPFNERDYTEYRKLYMRIKYRTNEQDRIRQLNHSKNQRTNLKTVC